MHTPDTPLRQPENGEKLVYLISADAPGCGAHTLAENIADTLGGSLLDTDSNMPVHTATSETAVTTPPIPTSADRRFYDSLPDQTCVVTGKLATTIGPLCLKDRATTAIDLTADPLVQAKRTLQRETGLSFPQIALEPTHLDQFLARYALAAEPIDQAKHRTAPHESLAASSRQRINTTGASPEEALSLVLGVQPKSDSAPEWELEALDKTVRDMDATRDIYGDRLSVRDTEHYLYNREKIIDGIRKLNALLDPAAVATTRNDLRNSIIDGWSSLLMKSSPRFFVDQNDHIRTDNKSHRWTPEFYKIAAAEPIFSERLRGKTVLDPFAGAGTLTNLLAGKEIPRKVYASDIAYPGGQPLDEEGHMYKPELNRKMWKAFFDDLPSWYRPNDTSLEPYQNANARHLPLEDGAVDYIVSDPPYAKNLPDGGLDLLFDVLPEFARVSKHGSILLVPVAWLDDLEQKQPYKITHLTQDVSRGGSNFPTCYVHISRERVQ
ncbi:hypothetical protein CR970_04355 [Candidatus Saccharibacteria bacterium]|nr:MAG: hypothetical protein CR970_04355 [Candidatus Saccharibacteria bacterium]